MYPLSPHSGHSQRILLNSSRRIRDEIIPEHRLCPGRRRHETGPMPPVVNSIILPMYLASVSAGRGTSEDSDPSSPRKCRMSVIQVSPIFNPSQSHNGAADQRWAVREYSRGKDHTLPPLVGTAQSAGQPVDGPSGTPLERREASVPTGPVTRHSLRAGEAACWATMVSGPPIVRQSSHLPPCSV